MSNTVLPWAAVYTCVASWQHPIILAKYLEVATSRLQRQVPSKMQSHEAASHVPAIEF